MYIMFLVTTADTIDTDLSSFIYKPKRFRMGRKYKQTAETKKRAGTTLVSFTGVQPTMVCLGSRPYSNAKITYFSNGVTTLHYKSLEH
jgi:hypothetical protein